MTSLKEYVDYGINKDDFVEMLRVSAATMRAQREGRVYIGVPSKSYREPGGSAFGKLIKRAGNPVQRSALGIQEKF